MKSSVRSQIFLAATALGVVFSTPAFAQADDGAATGDIVVTARRTEERLQDVPISITVYNQAQISNRNIVTATDLAVYTPSLTSNNRFGGDKSSFTLRGFGQAGKTAPTVALYFADVVSLRSNSGTGGSNGTGPGSFFDLQNVQVLKGPQGTLFGRNTTGGAILLVPQKPTDQLEGYVEGSVGNYNMKRVQAVLNVPLADTFKVRLGIDRQKRDGYLKNQSGRGPDDFADSNYIAVRGSIVGDLTPNLENYFIGTYSRSDTNGALFRIADCKRPNDPRAATDARYTPPTPGSRGALIRDMACAQLDRQNARGDGFYDVENHLLDPFNVTEQWQVINTTTWTINDDLTLKNIASYGEYREKFNSSIGGENWTVLTGSQTGMPLANVVISALPGQYSSIQSAFTEELQLQGKSLNNRLTWQVGAYLELSSPMKMGDTTFSQSVLNCSNVAAFQCVSSDAPVSGSLGMVYNLIKNRNIGFYGQGTYEFTDQLALTAGLRYTMDRMSGHGGRLQLFFAQPNTVTRIACSNSLLTPPAGSRDPRDCDSGPLVNETKRPTWLINLEYKPIPDVMVYAKYARGYRQGGVDPSVVGLESWDAEKLDSYEIGAKTSFSGAVRGYFNFAAFYNDFSNQQLATPAQGIPARGTSGANIIVNAGKSRIWGIEVDAAITPFDGLKLEGGYAYLNTELLEFVAESVPDNAPYILPPAPSVGGDLALSPHHRLTATATYTLPLDESIGRISFGGTFVYTSEQEAFDPAISPLAALPSSKLLNLNVNWDSVAGMPIDLAAFVTNVTKEEFRVNVSNNWNSNGYETVVTNQPRMWGVRMKYRFGS